ncbi:hypothetical protein H6F86_24530 [Phormidium sp. FACHB-592]|uniref:Uncharacterized protein n=1 Tax=Stenomitos frigidus AS-A4 TaxID=2933935 RepID=A0ABV0KL19_9CYAN|nr:hypothetical protein [Phormidium sp. FACHB-592]MBD2076994.1 hypothetical protein [Phormidium sp. FACHB-592]
MAITTTLLLSKVDQSYLTSAPWVIIARELATAKAGVRFHSVNFNTLLDAASTMPH